MRNGGKVMVSAVFTTGNGGTRRIIARNGKAYVVSGRAARLIIEMLAHCGTVVRNRQLVIAMFEGKTDPQYGTSAIGEELRYAVSVMNALGIVTTRVPHLGVEVGSL